MAWDNFHYVLGGRNVHLIPQGDGSFFQWSNCACATAAMHIMSERQGMWPGKGSPWPPNGASFRTASGDRSGGLLASLVDATSNRVYGVDPDFQILTSAQAIAKLRAGYGFSSLRAEGPILDAGFEGSAGFRKNHSSFVSGGRGAASMIEARDCNPLYDGRHRKTPLGPQWIPWRALVRASELLVIGDRGQRVIDRYGSGKLYVGLTRLPYRPDAKPVKHIEYSAAFGDGTFYIYKVRNGVIVGRDEGNRFSRRTSARCGPPHQYPWAGNVARRLVMITAGVLKGEYVAVPQGSVKLIEKEVI